MNGFWAGTNPHVRCDLLPTWFGENVSAHDAVLIASAIVAPTPEPGYVDSPPPAASLFERLCLANDVAPKENCFYVGGKHWAVIADKNNPHSAVVFVFPDDEIVTDSLPVAQSILNTLGACNG